jgi:RNA polymerase sigma factor (sigma-70 family)
MTNKQLDLCICEIATGNREALRQLYDEFKNPIFLFDLSILKNYQAAEDVEQDTFLNIMQSACKYRPGTNAKAWIFSITRNCCSDYLKTNTKYVPLEADISASEFYDGTTADFINEAPSVGGNTASLTKYGTTNWTNCQVFRTTSTWANLGSLTTESIIMKSKDGNRTLATPSGLSGQTFKSTWNNYS